MTHRGRGTLEVNPSRNPFFQTSNNDYGAKSELVDWRYKLNPNYVQSVSRPSEDNFAFLYAKSSDQIGAHAAKSTPFLPQMPSKQEFLKSRIEQVKQSTIGSSEYAELSKVTEVQSETCQIDTEQVLQVYKHVPKSEDPRYTTTGNEIGRKLPTQATFVAERYSKRQDFSKSFSNIKPKNTGLNTSITKSNIHSALDPQFL